MLMEHVKVNLYSYALERDWGCIPRQELPGLQQAGKAGHL